MPHNILFITADQLSFRAMPAHSGLAKTPNLDRIAQSAIQFDRCYTPCPMCQPARASFWSGRYPHETTVISNDGMFRREQIDPSLVTLGDVFAAAGYETMHFGKTHDAGALRGFTCAEGAMAEVSGPAAFPYTGDTKFDRHTADVAADWLRTPREKPFFAAVEFVNPHNICEWIGANEGVHENAEDMGKLPPLPENFRFDDIENRPRAMQYLCCSHRRQAQTAGWTDENFRAYLAAYYHYIERFDLELGLVLDALDASGQADNTLIVFTADHGDHMAARGMVTKHAAFYEEVTRVPLYIRLPGAKDAKGAKKHVDAAVSLIDLFPTFCAFADLPAPNGLRGVDLLALAAGNTAPQEAVFSEWHTEWGYVIAPGRMVCTDALKYTNFIGDGEELFDLRKDPFEARNVIHDPAYRAEAEAMRAKLAAYTTETNDDFFTLAPREAVTTPGWKTHTLGLQYHHGPAASDM